MKYIITLMIVLASMATVSMAKITYEEIVPQLNPCKPYIIERAPEPSSTCCAVLQGLDKVASGPKQDGKDICEILKTATHRMPIKIFKANRLPSKCGLHTLRRIDGNMNCNVAGTKAKLTNMNFDKDEDGIGVGLGSCDNRYHNNTDLFVSLCTKWYNGGSRCGKTIVVNSPNGYNVSAKVVSERATKDGCKDNVIVGSDSVWHTLNIDRKSQKWGWMNVTWTDL